MRISVPILLLLSLAGCQQRGAAGQTDASETGAVPSDEELLRGIGDPGRIQALIERAMSTIPDAASARYRNVRPGAGGAACGEVSLKSTPFRPFVVTPEAVAVIAATPTLAFNDPADIAADAWIRWCATPEELERLPPRLTDPVLPTLDADANGAAPAELPIPSAVPEPTAAAPAPPPPSAAAKKAPPPEIDSFFNSVQRSGD
jgi:hypothetical protein